MPTPSRRADVPSSPQDNVRARLTLARKWSYRLLSCVAIPMGSEELGHELSGRLDALCEMLHQEPFSIDAAEQAGVDLAGLGHLGKLGLRCTTEVLGKGLLALPEFQPVERYAERIALAMGALGCGFTDANTESVLAQQESMQRSLLKAVRDANWNLKESEARFNEVVTSSASGVLIVDLEGRLLRVNAAVGDILGHAPDELTGTPLLDLIASGFGEMLQEALADLVDGTAERIKQSQRMVRKDGEPARLTLTASLLRGADDEPSYFVVVVEDGTELALLQGELNRQALHDVLTGLPNRQFFTTHLETVLRRADPEFGVTVFHLDLDAFGLVCNSLGGRVGEQLLQHVARRLRALMSREQAMVARFDGDEFGIVVENTATTPDIATTMAAINADLAEPIFVDEHGLAVSVSAGVVHRPSPDVDPVELLRMADLALRQAKKDQRGQWELFHGNHDTDRRRDHALAVVMPGAWEQGDIGVCYRPVRVLATGDLAGVEAVLHWDLSDRCAELADQTGLILPMGEWLIRIAAGQAQWWRQRGELDEQFGIRLTRHQATDGDLVARLAKVFEETGMPPARLTLTMPVGVLDVAGAAENLSTLADMGVRIALDEFGLGPRDLAWLSELPIVSVSVSDDLVQRRDARSAALIPAVHEMGVNLCVGGIETAEQAKWWTEAGADLGIGAYFGLPVDAGEFLKKLR